MPHHQAAWLHTKKTAGWIPAYSWNIWNILFAMCGPQRLQKFFWFSMAITHTRQWQQSTFANNTELFFYAFRHTQPTSSNRLMSHFLNPSSRYESSDRPLRSKRRKRCPTSNDRGDQRIEPAMCPCIYCCEEFVSSRPGEEWIKCDACQNWAHVLCSGYERGLFVCDFCKMWVFCLT